MVRLRLGFLAGLALLTAAMPAQADPDAIRVLAPSTPWNVDYDVESCRLQRAFGTGDDKVVLRLMQYGLEPPESLLVSGKGLASSGGPKLVYTFEPDGVAPVNGNPMFGKDADGIVTWQLSTQFLSPDIYKLDLEPAQLQQRLTARLAQIRSFAITKGVKKPVRLQLGALVKPMAAMNACIDNLVRTWGLDPAVQRTRRSAPEPTSSPARWLRHTDYPTELIRQNVSGRIDFRLMVDANGAVTNCMLQGLFSDARFKDVVCPLLTRRARFKPALDANGAAIASFYQQTVVFVTSG